MHFIFFIAEIVMHYSCDLSVVVRFERFNGQIGLKVNIHFVADFVQGFLGAPVDIQVVPSLLQVLGDDFAAINKLVGYSFDIMRHIFQIYAYTFVFAEQYGRLVMGM
jgi:hypothetical protein